MMKKRIYISLETLVWNINYSNITVSIGKGGAAGGGTGVTIQQDALSRVGLLMQKGFDVIFFYTGQKLDNKPTFEANRKWLTKYFSQKLPQGQTIEPILIYVHSTEILKGHVLIDSKPHKPGDQPFDGTLLLIGENGHYKNWTDLYEFIIKSI